MGTLSKVNFLPWVGEKYDSNGIFGKKIMILGQSHYGHCSEEERMFTNNVLSGYLNSGESVSSELRTFKVFERSLYGKETNLNDRRSIWESLIFYNYVQNSVGDSAGVAPKKKDYIESEDAFFQVLEKYRPEYVIVWGTSTWYNLPCTKWQEGEKIFVDGRDIFNGSYTLKDGSNVQMICVKHPSYGYSWRFWNKVLSQFGLTVNSVDYGQLNQELEIVKEKATDFLNILRSAKSVDDCLNRVQKELGVSYYTADYLINMSFRDFLQL